MVIATSMKDQNIEQYKLENKIRLRLLHRSMRSVVPPNDLTPSMVNKLEPIPYKFAFAKSLLELVNNETTRISLKDLSELKVFADVDARKVVMRNTKLYANELTNTFNDFAQKVSSQIMVQ